MYIPKSFEISNIDTIRRFISDIEFGQIVTFDSNSFKTTLAPFILIPDNESDILIAHFAKSNEHWASVEEGINLISFLGPHSYISYRDYGLESGIPTWNYAIVNSYCHATILDLEENIKYISSLLERHEEIAHDIPMETIKKYAPSTVGIKFTVDRYECKFKFSQNRDKKEFDNMVLSIKERSDHKSIILSEFIGKYLNQR